MIEHLLALVLLGQPDVIYSPYPPVVYQDVMEYQHIRGVTSEKNKFYVQVVMPDGYKTSFPVINNKLPEITRTIINGIPRFDLDYTIGFEFTGIVPVHYSWNQKPQPKPLKRLSDENIERPLPKAPLPLVLIVPKGMILPSKVGPPESLLGRWVEPNYLGTLNN